MLGEIFPDLSTNGVADDDDPDAGPERLEVHVLPRVAWDDPRVAPLLEEREPAHHQSDLYALCTRTCASGASWSPSTSPSDRATRSLAHYFDIVCSLRLRADMFAAERTILVDAPMRNIANFAF